MSESRHHTREVRGSSPLSPTNPKLSGVPRPGCEEVLVVWQRPRHQPGGEHRAFGADVAEGPSGSAVRGSYRDLRRGPLALSGRSSPRRFASFTFCPRHTCNHGGMGALLHKPKTGISNAIGPRTVERARKHIPTPTRPPNNGAGVTSASWRRTSPDRPRPPLSICPGPA